MMDLSKLVWDIATAPSVSLPADPEACKECVHKKRAPLHGHCYMFKNLPDTLCMQFAKDTPNERPE